MIAILPRVILLELSVALLIATPCLAAAPASAGRELAPVELIEKALPAGKTIKSASKAELVSAVCAAVRQERDSGAGMTLVAVAARPELAGDLVGAILRCATKIDCEYVSLIVSTAVTAQPGAATAISDAAIGRAPNCGESIQGAVRTATRSANSRPELTLASPPGQGALIGTRGGANEGFDPHEPLVLVCEDGTPRAVRQSEIDEFLRTHPGAVSGNCPPAAGTARTPVPAASPAVKQ